MSTPSRRFSIAGKAAQASLWPLNARNPRPAAVVRAKLGSGFIGQIANGFFIAVYAAAITPTLRSARESVVATGDSDAGNTIVSAFLLVLMTVWVLANFDRFKQLARHVWPYALIVGLCFLSALWSPYRLATIRRSVTLALCVVYGTYLYHTFGVTGIARLVARTSLVLGILSIALFVAVPSLGHDQELTYLMALRGVFSSKNTAGEMMVLGICSAMYLGSRPGNSKLVAILSSLLMFGIILLTRSATSLLIAAILIGLGGFTWTKNWRIHLILAFGIATVAISLATFAIVDLDGVFGLVGRDSSLTGRLPLWQEVVKAIAARPLLGYGYSGFWVAESPDIQYLWLKVGWPAPSAHDGYMDIVLQIGFAGLFLYLFMWGRVVRRNLTLTRMRTSPETAFITSFMLVNVLLNIDEGPLPYPDEFTLLMPACLIFLAEQYQLRRPAPLRQQTRSGRLPIRSGMAAVHRRAFGVAMPSAMISSREVLEPSPPPPLA